MGDQTAFSFAAASGRRRPVFYLGTHMPNWLAQLDVPLFVSRRRLFGMKTLPRARGLWALDSGGFTELSMHGSWTVSATQYAGEVRRFRDEIGGMSWAAPQDMMCEPAIRERTGLSVEEHQRRTIDNLLELRSLAPEVPWVPVLQGWMPADYWRHVEAYASRGVELLDEPLVGVGTVCRRQGMGVASIIMRTLAADGLRLHGFGFKTQGLRACGDALTSADSLAWSYDARRSEPLEGCRHRSCANCQRYAVEWRDRLLAKLGDACE